MLTPPYKKIIEKAVRLPNRPIISPREGDTQFWWEAHGTFNPGVAEYNNQVILLYRAYDQFRISRLGIAHSKDGIEFVRYNHPAVDTNPDDAFERLGIEDPRITYLDGTYYILHSSASYYAIGKHADVSGVMDHIPWRVRIGMHTTTDFKSYRHWGVLIPDVAAKNACLLPAKVNGMFALYYREHSPEGGEILKFSLTKDFQHWQDTRIIQWPMVEPWQQAKIGVGSQPIETSAGYLMVYHAVDAANIYRLGIVLFDKSDPARILWYSDAILEPEMPYEKEGYIPNVVYCCGAILRDAELWIYYGASDLVIGRAVLQLPKDIL